MIAVGQFTIYDFHDVHSSPTAPTNPVKDMVWLDTSVKPPLMRVWDGKAWVLANDFTDEIDKKADSDDVYNKNEVYTKTETDSKIKVAKDGIDLSVSKLQTTVNNHTTQINNKADLNDVNQKINDIKIGGTNLYRNTKNVIASDWGNAGYWSIINLENGFSAFSRRGSWQGLYQSIEYEVGQVYTLSAYVRGSNGAKLNFYYTGYGSTQKTSFGRNDQYIVPSDWVRVWVTFKVVGSEFSKPRFENPIDEGTLQLYAIKLEKGTKDTDWSPSPKDVQDAINNKANTSDVYNKEQINDSLQGLIDQTKNLQDEYSNLVDDKKITPNEKIQLKSELAQIQSKTEAMEGIVDALKDSTLSTYMNTLKQKKADVEAKLNPILANMTITSDVSETDVHAAINAFYEAYEVALKLAQMSMNATLTETKTQLSVVADGMNVAINKSQEALDMKYKVGKHFNFTDQGWVEIFASINGQQGRFKTQITDQQLAFTDSGNVVAYLSNQELFITMARIVNALQIGNIGLETSGDKGGIIFKWRD